METGSSEEGDKTAALFFVLPRSNKSMGAPAPPMPTTTKESGSSLFYLCSGSSPAPTGSGSIKRKILL